MPEAIGWQYGVARGPAECEPEFAGLWNGLGGLWVPALGPTGSKLWDLSRYLRSGTVTGATWVPGPALDFDGSNDRVDFAAGLLPRLHLPHTFACKVTVDSIATAARYLLAEHQADDAHLGVVMVHSTTGALFWQAINVTGGAGALSITSANSLIAAGGTYTVVFTYDGSGTSAGIIAYLDGVALTPSAVQGPTTVNASTGSNSLGGRIYDNARNFDGRMHWAALWSRVLLPGEVAQLYADPGGMTRPARRPWLWVTTGGGGGTSRTLEGVIAGEGAAAINAMLRARPVAGAATGAGAAAAALAAVRPILGSAVGVGEASGRVALSINIAGGATGAATAALSALLRARALAGTTEGVATVSGAASAARPVDGLISGVGAVAGAAGAARPVIGTTTGSGSLPDAIALVLRQISGGPAGEGVVIGTLDVDAAGVTALAGTIAGVGVVAGDVVVTRAIAGGAVGAGAIQSALLSALRELHASAVGAAVVSGALSTTIVVVFNPPLAGGAVSPVYRTRAGAAAATPHLQADEAVWPHYTGGEVR